MCGPKRIWDPQVENRVSLDPRFNSHYQKKTDPIFALLLAVSLARVFILLVIFWHLRELRGLCAFLMAAS